MLRPSQSETWWQSSRVKLDSHVCRKIWMTSRKQCGDMLCLFSVDFTRTFINKVVSTKGMNINLGWTIPLNVPALLCSASTGRLLSNDITWSELTVVSWIIHDVLCRARDVLHHSWKRDGGDNPFFWPTPRKHYNRSQKHELEPMPQTKDTMVSAYSSA